MAGPQIKWEMLGDAKKIIQALAAADARIEKMESKLAKVGQTSKKTGASIETAGKKTQSGFGPKAMAQLKNYALGLASIGAAAGMAKRAIESLNAVKEASATSVRSAEFAAAGLVQMAGGDRKLLREYIDSSKQLYAGGGARNLPEAYGTMEKLISAGAYGQRGLLADLMGIAKEPAAMAKGVATMLASMGEAETGGLRDIVSKATAAAKGSPVPAGKLLEGASRSAAFAGMLGVSDEALLSGTAILADATGSLERGADQLKAFLRDLTKDPGQRFTGRALADTIAQITSMGLNPPELQAMLGSSEAVSAYAILARKQPEFTSLMGEQDAAVRDDLVGKLLTSREVAPEIMAPRAGRIAKARRELGEEELGTLRTISDAVIDEQITLMRDAGKSELQTWLSEQWVRGGRSVGGLFGDTDRFIVETFGYPEHRNILSSMDRGGSPQGGDTGQAAATDRLVRASEAQEQTTRNLVDAIQRTRGGPTLAKPNEDR